MKGLQIVIARLYILAATLKTNPFSYFSDNSVSSSSAARGTGASFYQLIKTLGVIGIALTLVWGGVMLAFTKSSQKREEQKIAIMWKCCIFVAIFAFVTVIGWIAEIANHIV